MKFFGWLKRDKTEKEYGTPDRDRTGLSGAFETIETGGMEGAGGRSVRRVTHVIKGNVAQIDTRQALADLGMNVVEDTTTQDGHDLTAQVGTFEPIENPWEEDINPSSSKIHEQALHADKNAPKSKATQAAAVVEDPDERINDKHELFIGHTEGILRTVGYVGGFWSLPENVRGVLLVRFAGLSRGKSTVLDCANLLQEQGILRKVRVDTTGQAVTLAIKIPKREFRNNRWVTTSSHDENLPGKWMLSPLYSPGGGSSTPKESITHLKKLTPQVKVLAEKILARAVQKEGYELGPHHEDAIVKITGTNQPAILDLLCALSDGGERFLKTPMYTYGLGLIKVTNRDKTEANKYANPQDITEQWWPMTNKGKTVCWFSATAELVGSTAMLSAMDETDQVAFALHKGKSVSAKRKK